MMQKPSWVWLVVVETLKKAKGLRFFLLYHFPFLCSLVSIYSSIHLSIKVRQFVNYSIKYRNNMVSARVLSYFALATIASIRSLLLSINHRWKQIHRPNPSPICNLGLFFCSIIQTNLKSSQPSVQPHILSAAGHVVQIVLPPCTPKAQARPS